MSARDEVKLIGSTVMADEVQGSVEVQANTIRLDTAETKTTHTLVKEEQTVAGVKPSVSKDEITAGGFSVTDHKEETITVTESHAGSALSGNNIVLRADSSISLVNADVMATGKDGNLVLDASEVTVTGIHDTRKVNHTEETVTVTTSVGVRNAYVDTAYAVKALEEAGEEVDRARRALSDAERSYDKGEISAGALDDYKAMLAMATANFVQAELAAAQALAAAAVTAGSSAGTGFYVSGSAQVTETRSKSNDNAATWQGSSLSAANMSINADAASIIGSDISAGALAMNADKILLGAGTNTQSSNFEQESRNVSAGVSSSGAGSWNASVGYNEASSSSEATQHVNTRINVGHLSSTSDELTLRGAIVTADTADITTHTLTVESLQDTHKSKNSSMGVNVGVGAGNDSVGKPQSGSGGANFAKGDSKGAITGEQTAILIGNGADSQITANHTNLIGGMIANATWEIPEGADENTAPVLVDHGQLNFTTDTLTVEDLRDYSRSSQTGAGLQVSASTTTISATDEGHRMEGKTLATIGGGNVLVGGLALDENEDFAELNRNVDKGQIVTLDQQTGAMNASVTLDNRMFTEAGRQQIVEQHQEVGSNAKAVVAGTSRDLLRVTGTHSAYEVMFEKGAKMYVLLYDDEGNVRRDEKGVPLRRELTEDEMNNLQRSEDGKVYIANNGINNDQDGAARYAAQHGVAREGEEDIARVQHFIEFEKASVLGELVVAFYQKHLEGDFWGLTNPVMLNKEMMYFYGSEGLHLDGHSRGSMTIGNAMKSMLNDPYAVGAMGGLSVNFFGPAFNVYTGDDLLAQLQNRSFYPESDHSGMSLHYQNHRYDPVGRLPFLGNNPSTGGTIPEGGSVLGEGLKAIFGKESTTHNCYGNASPSQSCGVLWSVPPVLVPTVTRGK